MKNRKEKFGDIYWFQKIDFNILGKKKCHQTWVESEIIWLFPKQFSGFRNNLLICMMSLNINFK